MRDFFQLNGHTQPIMTEDAIRCVTLVSGFFENDEKKVVSWFGTENPSLGNFSPKEMMAVGKTDRLLKWIREQMKENVK